MTTATQHSARRVIELVRCAHGLLEGGVDPADEDPWMEQE